MEGFHHVVVVVVVVVCILDNIMIAIMNIIRPSWQSSVAEGIGFVAVRLRYYGAIET